MLLKRKMSDPNPASVKTEAPDHHAGPLLRKSTDKSRLSCDIDKKLHRRLRMAAIQNDTTMLALIEKMIEEGTDP